MRKVKYHVASSLDGFIAHEDDSYGAFLQERLVKDSEHISDYIASFATYDTVLLGRRTYELGLKQGAADPYPNMVPYVFTRTMKERPHPKVKLVSENATGVVRELKVQEGKDIYLCGGNQLASLLLEAGLVDEVLVKLSPLLLGSGVPLSSKLKGFKSLELLSTKVYKNGVLLLRYAVLPEGAPGTNVVTPPGMPPAE
ncbi:dihydrofolate reductase family protein [Pyxidicoccus xibeiensis]|uniref:dihydrofolate reductase family protein n=1 Tax=Pyxidicoccus xibeiensis TaxID=2906759 RepID=UPI0020A7820F|nr:dihydrofolate reductase family protein [Pyxidicoccus xibeiensis]MCP3139064.1 dihydrofolate reductase family protein [Pyxidicoccus xibeiensis]